MEKFEIVIFIMTILVGLALFADKIKLPYPILLVMVGLFIGFMPMLPNLALDPEIVFLVFLPPLLYDAASKTSWHDFKKEIKPISTLAITLVFFTTVTVAVAAHYLIPNFSWPLAFVLGAIVSPPDAVAATSIIKGLGLNRKVITIIEGESLVNDASALIAYKYAVAAAVSGSFILWKATVEFVFVAAGGILIGLIVGYIFSFIHTKVKDNPIVGTSLSLLTPFVAYIFAEKCHTSGVLAVVSAGIYINWKSRELFSGQTRIHNTIIWDTCIFLLNGVIFILIGLQLPEIVKGFKEQTLWQIVRYGLVISLVTIVIRILWVFAGAYHQKIFKRNTELATNDAVEKVSWKNVLIVAWTGTRGVVSLATALALPFVLPSGDRFPKRGLILFLAFIVIFVTLVIQGLTLPLLIKLLNIKPDLNQQKQDEKELQKTLTENILQYLENNFPIEIDDKVLDQIKQRHKLSYNLLSDVEPRNKWEKQQNLTQLSFINQMLTAQLEIVSFERELLIQFYKEGTFNDETLRKAEQELDIEELRLQAMVQKKESLEK